MEVMKEYVEEMLKKSKNSVDKLLIDDIFDISNGLYKSYDDYVEYKQKIIEMVRNHNNQCFNPHNENYRFTYYVEPVIINKDYFDYIVSKCL